MGLAGWRCSYPQFNAVNNLVDLQAIDLQTIGLGQPGLQGSNEWRDDAPSKSQRQCQALLAPSMAGPTRDELVTKTNVGVVGLATTPASAGSRADRWVAAPPAGTAAPDQPPVISILAGL